MILEQCQDQAERQKRPLPPAEFSQRFLPSAAEPDFQFQPIMDGLALRRRKLGHRVYEQRGVDFAAVFVDCLPSALHFLVFELVQLQNSLLELALVLQRCLLLPLQLLVLLLSLGKHRLHLRVNSVSQLVVVFLALFVFSSFGFDINSVEVVDVIRITKILFLPLNPIVLVFQISQASLGCFSLLFFGFELLLALTDLFLVIVYGSFNV